MYYNTIKIAHFPKNNVLKIILFLICGSIILVPNIFGIIVGYNVIHFNCTTVNLVVWLSMSSLSNIIINIIILIIVGTQLAKNYPFNTNTKRCFIALYSIYTIINCISGLIIITISKYECILICILSVIVICSNLTILICITVYYHIGSNNDRMEEKYLISIV